MKSLSIIIVTCLLLGVLGCAASTPAPAPGLTPTPKSVPLAQPTVIKWNGQVSYPPTAGSTLYYANAWAEWVKDVTGGRLIVEVHPTGTFAPGDSKMLDTLSKGAFDIAWDYSGYYTSTIPVSDVESGLPMAWNEAFEVQDAYLNRGLFDLIKGAYAPYNVVPLGVGYDLGTWYNFGTKFDFNSLDDIKGKKIRALGMYGKFVQALGGSPTVIASGELYMALKTGIVDGLIYSVSCLDTLKLGEVLSSYVVEPTLTPIVTIMPKVNKNSWDKLPDDIKKILEGTKYFNALAAMRYKLLSFNSTVIATKTWGTKLVNLSPSDEKRARDICFSLWDEVAKKDALAAKGVEIVRQQMRDYGRMK